MGSSRPEADTSKLEADVTPWWWAPYWDARMPEIQRALRVLTSIRHVEVTGISISRSGLKLTMAVTLRTDMAKLEQEAADLHWFLDEMIKLPVAQTEMVN